MTIDDLRDRLDVERRQFARVGERLEILPDVTRLQRGQAREVVFSALSSATADDVIAREIAHHRALGAAFEWKVYGHDRPADLRDRLERQGVLVGAREAVLVYQLDDLIDTHGGAGCRVVRVRDVDGLRDYRRVAEAALGKNYDATIAALSEALAIGSTEHLGYVAYLDAEPVAVGRLYTHRHSLFGGLYGGATRPEFRGRGCYRALVAARAADARAFGARYLQVDALPTSRPILERMGFRWVTDTWPCEWRPPPAGMLHGV